MDSRNEQAMETLRTVGVLSEELTRWSEYRGHCNDCHWMYNGESVWGKAVEHVNTRPLHTVIIKVDYRSITRVRRRS